MSTVHSAKRAIFAFVLAAVMLSTGFVAFAGPGTALADENPPAPIATPQEDSLDDAAVSPATDETAADAIVVEPALDEGTAEREPAAEETSGDAPGGLIAPAPDEGTAGREPAAEETSGDAPGGLIAPAPDDGESEMLIAPAPDDGEDEGLIAPAPDKDIEEPEQAATDSPEDASGEALIAPAPEGGESEGLIAPAAGGENKNDAVPWWPYALLAGAGLAVVGGGLAWRFRPHKS